jgi:hypothetical protein
MAPSPQAAFAGSSSGPSRVPRDTVKSARTVPARLRDRTGELTFLLFAAGIIGTDLLAPAALAGSAACAVTEKLGFKAACKCQQVQQVGCYGSVGAATLGGGAVTRRDAIAMLF